MNEPTNERSMPDSTKSADSDLEREIEAALGDQSVEDLMAQDEAAARAADSAPTAAESSPDTTPKPQTSGQVASMVRRGRVTRVQGEDVLVELHAVDGKNTGVVPASQFDRPPRPGAIMDFVVNRFDEAEGLYILSREGAIGEATWEQLNVGSAVEARVTGTNKGGLELELVGRIRGFMPASQIDLHHVNDFDSFVGQKLTAVATEVDRKGRRVVLSRRQHLQNERERAERRLLGELEVGQVREGKVSSLADYGAFVDLGGMDGLVHVSDMSHSRVEKPGDVLSVGQDVTVKVLKIDAERKRISLGLKQLAPDPWDGIGDRIRPGDQISGRVLRVANFGAFIEIEPGLEGLLPTSEMSWSRNIRPQDVVKEGDVLRLNVLTMDPAKHRISLSLKQAAGDPWVGAEHKFPAMAVVEATVRSITDFGAFVEIEQGIEGLVHISELADRRVNKVEEILKVGQTEKFRILEIDEESRRIKLSLKAVKNPPSENQPARREEGKTLNLGAKPAPKRENLQGGLGNVGGIGLGDLGNLDLG